MLTQTPQRAAVLHFASEPVRGGAEEHMLALLRRLDRGKFRPLLAAHPGLLDLLRGDLPGDVMTFPLELRGLRDLRGGLRLWQILREQRVAVLHSHMFQASRLASPIAWAAGVRAIETPHIRESWRKGWLKGSFVIDRLVGRAVSRFIAVSRANASYLVNEKRLPPKKVVVVRNGIPVERFSPEYEAPSAMRQRLGLEPADPVALIAARLEPQKGHQVLLDAWPAVVRQDPRARLLIIGDGSLRAALEAQAAILQIDQSVHFCGYQTNVADWLALADLTVLPSFYEGLPLAAIESLAAGRPVIATAVDGTSEVVIAEQTGLLVPPGDAGALSRAIVRLFAERAFARELGQAGHRLVEREFDEARQVAETEAVYAATLEEAFQRVGRKSIVDRFAMHDRASRETVAEGPRQ